MTVELNVAFERVVIEVQLGDPFQITYWEIFGEGHKADVQLESHQQVPPRVGEAHPAKG